MQNDTYINGAQFWLFQLDRNDKKLKKFKLLLHPKPGAADDPEKKESLRNDEFTLVYRLPYLKIILNHKKFVYV